MNIREKVEFILLKFPATKFHRSEFLLCFLAEFHQAEYKDMNYIIPAIELRQFFAELETINRTLRAFLKEDKRFSLPKECDLLRKRKEFEFKINFSKIKTIKIK